ncbi:sulfotransferase family protein [Salipiger sp.]|uniref:sulfotransferase family protein n=1 Tax=Salipiger sp. TaxID=2078585 RepID=UPI003A97A234
MTKKTFLLCTGAAKSGTTWIRRYLGDSPGADMGRMGEMQIWDAITLPANARYRIADPSPLRRAEYALARALHLPVRGEMFRHALQSDPDRYFAYFRNILDRPGITLTGDITPGYAGLSADTLAMIRNRLGADGIETRAVFSMRDPVERAWSALRMHRRKGRLPADQSDADAFVERYGPGGTESEVPYATSIANLEAVFPEDRLFLTLFESLFRPGTIAAFSDFAGVPARADAGSERVNEAANAASLPPDLARAVFPAFAGDYAAILSRIPEAARLWPHAHLLG